MVAENTRVWFDRGDGTSPVELTGYVVNSAVLLPTEYVGRIVNADEIPPIVLEAEVKFKGPEPININDPDFDAKVAESMLMFGQVYIELDFPEEIKREIRSRLEAETTTLYTITDGTDEFRRAYLNERIERDNP